MEEKVGWNLWELDRHHGELWESRFQKTFKNPTVLKISTTPASWAIFRDGIKPMWEDEQNCGTGSKKDLQVSGIIYTRKKNFDLWLNTSEPIITNELKKKFSQICNRNEYEIRWDNFIRSKKKDLNLHNVIWKYGQLSSKAETLTNSSVYNIDIMKTSPNFVICYKKQFPIKCVECFLVETRFSSPFDSNSIKKFVESCFFWFQKSKSNQIIGIAKAIALKIINKKITIRFYTDPVGYCRIKGVKYTNFHEVLILFAQQWKTQLLTNFISPDSNLKMNGLREKDRDIQFTI